MEEARRIMDNSARMPAYHGSTSAEVVEQILDTCGGEIFCRGELRIFVFDKITDNRFMFKTRSFYEASH